MSRKLCQTLLQPDSTSAKRFATPTVTQSKQKPQNWEKSSNCYYPDLRRGLQERDTNNLIH